MDFVTKLLRLKSVCCLDCSEIQWKEVYTGSIEGKKKCKRKMRANYGVN